MHRRYASLPETFWVAFADAAHFPAQELLQLSWHALSLKDVLNVSKLCAPTGTVTPLTTLASLTNPKPETETGVPPNALPVLGESTALVYASEM